MPNTANINATIEVLRGLKPEEFSMKHSETCIVGQADKAGCSYDETVGEFLGLREDYRDNSNSSIVCPPFWWTQPELYPIPVAIRMLEIARDDGVVDWARARDEIANGMQHLSGELREAPKT